MSAREAVLEELDAAVSAPSGAAVVSGAPTCSVALLGQPNSGKSTLFNARTGSRQRVGNWPGKTVEKKEGGFSRGGVDYAVCDLPGTYSLSANSEEEVVTRDYIASGRADVVCVLADASQLERSLYMLADFAGVDCACMLVLNLMDVAEAQGKRIDAKVLERRLGIPVVPFVAADRAHCDLFYQALDRAIADPHALDATALAEACRVEFGAVYDDERAGLVMELPPYHAPRWKNVFSTAIARSKHVFKRAVRVVFIVTAVVWLLVYSPDGNPQNTALYAIGEAIEPVTSFFGLGWQTFMAYLCAMAIKESALGVLSGLFLGTGTLTTAVGGMGPVAADIGQVMASAISQPEALAFMFAFTFNVPCMASVAATYGETHSGKWTALMIAFYFCASLALAFVVFHVSSLFLG